METLAEHARSIDKIMSVISRYRGPDQPACAQCGHRGGARGEAGRGFAVVADEVRKLAEKTMTSTTEVGSAIQAIQQSAGKSAQQVDRAVRHIAQANEFSNHSGEMLKILQMVEQTARRGSLNCHGQRRTGGHKRGKSPGRSTRSTISLLSTSSAMGSWPSRGLETLRARSRELVQLVGK